MPRRLILVVDDDIEISDVLDSVLIQHGYRVVVAENGAEALARLKEQRPDLILLDMRMPVMDGPELYRRLGELPHPPPVIFMSAYQDAAEIARSLGAAHVLKKPFELAELYGQIERLIGGP